MLNFLFQWRHGPRKEPNVHVLVVGETKDETQESSGSEIATLLLYFTVKKKIHTNQMISV